MSDSANQPAQAKKGSSKLLMIGLPVIVLLLGGAGGGYWYVQSVRAAAATTEKKPVEEKEPTGLLAFDSFTVNLADPGGRRYLRVAVSLVLPDEEMAKKVDEEDLAKSKIRSTLIDVLSGRLATELSTPAGRTELKHAIAEAASHAGHIEVKDVLFQDFIVQ
jgi:flagellar FliL protein